MATNLRKAHSTVSTFPIGTIHLFKAKLQAFLVEACCCGHPMVESIAPDRAFEGMLLLKKDADALPGTGGVYWQKSNKLVVLNFIGLVDFCPVAGALPLCKAFGLQWFMNPPKEKHCASFDAWWPAWCVGVVAKKKEKDEKGKANELKLAISKNEVAFKFQYKVLLGVKTEVTTLSLWSLTFPKGANAVSEVMVTHDPISEAITKDGLKEFLDKIPRPAQRVKAAANREEKERFLNEWPCKHIFT